MGRKKDLTGLVFGRLTVKKETSKRFRGSVVWECICQCGKKVPIPASSLTSGNTRSCGCLHKEETIRNATTHGLCRDRVYRIWQGMKRRCSNPNFIGYGNYGGRGISYCAEWEYFENFLKDMGTPPTDTHTLERVDVNGDYEPSNCKWATKEEQTQNQRRTKLNPTIVKEIRAFKDQGLTPLQVSLKYPTINVSTLSNAYYGRSWRNVR